MSAVVGTAGWSIPQATAAAFLEHGTALERYAKVFGGVEVNSSFYRSHRPATWSRWAASVPDAFRFAVKLPRTITHVAKLVGAKPLVASFADEVRHLGDKLAVVLVQLPPSLAFDAATAERFFADLERATDAAIVCEPRHIGWFSDDADGLLEGWRVARVAADPALAPVAAVPGGWRGISYWRLHGSPLPARHRACPARRS